MNWKVGVGIAAGALVLGSVVSVAAQEGAPAPSSAPAQAGRGMGPGGGGRPAMRGLRRAIRADVVLPGVNGGAVREVKTDRGVLGSSSGKTLTLSEHDGTTVQITVDDATRIRRDGSQATLADLKTGDHLLAVRVKDGTGDFVTKAVLAMSDERFQQRQDRRGEGPGAAQRSGEALDAGADPGISF